MQQALSINNALVAIIGSLVGWGGFLTLVWFLKGAIVEAFSLAAATVLRTSDKPTQKWFIRCLVQRNLTLNSLYAEIKAEKEADAEEKSSGRKKSEAA